MLQYNPALMVHIVLIQSCTLYFFFLLFTAFTSYVVNRYPDVAQRQGMLWEARSQQLLRSFQEGQRVSTIPGSPKKGTERRHRRLSRRESGSESDDPSGRHPSISGAKKFPWISQFKICLLPLVSHCLHILLMLLKSVICDMYSCGNEKNSIIVLPRLIAVGYRAQIEIKRNNLKSWKNQFVGQKTEVSTRKVVTWRCDWRLIRVFWIKNILQNSFNKQLASRKRYCHHHLSSHCSRDEAFLVYEIFLARSVVHPIRLRSLLRSRIWNPRADPSRGKSVIPALIAKLNCFTRAEASSYNFFFSSRQQFLFCSGVVCKNWYCEKPFLSNWYLPLIDGPDTRVG